MEFKKAVTVALQVFFLGLIFVADCAMADDLEWSVIKTIDLKAEPVDVALSADGNQLFILTRNGEVLVYASGSSPIHKIKVGNEFSQIEISPKGDMLILTSRKEKKTDIIKLEFIKDIDISGSPFKGTENAPVEIVVFTDFQCPYCAKIALVLDQIQKKYPEDVKIVVKNFPLRNHKFAMKAAQAVLAADKKGKFWEYHDLLFKNYNQLNDEKINAITREVGLNETEFETVLREPAIQSKIQKDVLDGRKAGVKGTPSIFINGKALGNVSFQILDAAIGRELSKIKKE